MNLPEKYKTILRSLLSAAAGGYVVASLLMGLSMPRTDNRMVFPDNMARAIGLMGGVLSPTSVLAQIVVEGKGKVIAVMLEKQQIVLEHGEIKGFMDAMTMGYKVSARSLLNDVKPGDEVRFSIDTQKNTIVTLDKEPK